MTLELDPDRGLALAYVPAARRAAVDALWRLDVTLASVLATGSDPMVSRIRLAWWREALEKLDLAPAPPEPVLQSLAAHVLPAGIAGAGLAVMEEGWLQLLSPDPLGADALERYAALRGGVLFRLTAQLLGRSGDVEEAGALWALADFARRSSVGEEAESALDLARSKIFAARWPAPLRPLGMLARLARRDALRGAGNLEPHGAPPRLLSMLAHRLTGR